MADPKSCCGVTPKGFFDTKLKKWFFKCDGQCGRATTGHAAKKKAIEAWNKLVDTRRF